MRIVDSTVEILALKVLDRNTNKRWVNWAVDMLSAGFETQHLLILANETEPFNQFEMKDLTDRVLNELNLDYSNEELIMANYVRFLITRALGNPNQIQEVLAELKDLCIELDFDRSLYDFYLLYFAREDLQQYENQQYWEGATKDNIEVVIRDYFSKRLH